MPKEIRKILAATGLLALAFLFLWVNRFQYEHTGTTQVLVRINRLTSQECYLTTDRGWDSRLILPGQKDDIFAKYGGHAITDAEKSKSQTFAELLSEASQPINRCR
jgi:hypothetical protein